MARTRWGKRRKMGHINVIGTSINEVKHRIDALVSHLYPEGLNAYLY